MIESGWRELLPGEFAVADTLLADEPPPLLPTERQFVATAAPARQREFAWSRACARRALRSMDHPGGPIMRGPHRQPIWPKGYIGSISHCRDYAVAAVTRDTRYVSVGVDVELTAARLTSGVVSVFATAEEIEWLAAEPKVTALLVFSAKESFYKALFPLTGRWLEFRDVTVSLVPGTNRFDVTVVGAARSGLPVTLSRVSGRYLTGLNRILTAVVIASDASKMTP